MDSTTELKRQILERGVKSLMEEAKVPQHIHLAVIQKLHEALQSHQTAIQGHEQVLKRHDSHMTAHERQIAEWDAAVQHVLSLNPEKGEPGQDAEEVDVDALVERIYRMLDIPSAEEVARLAAKQIRPPKDGEPGKDAKIDYDKAVKMVVEKIKKEKPIDISDIRNAQSFMFNKKRYKLEELMHGSGGSSTTSGKSVVTQYLLTAVQVASDVTIDLTQLSHWATFDQLIAVYRNNVPQTQTLNFTISGSTLTIFGADASEIYNVTYSYA